MTKKARSLLCKDPRFRKVIANTKLRRRDSTDDVYAALLRTIIFQQLSGKAAHSIHQRFLGLFQNGYPNPSQLIRLSQVQLAGAGLSGQKSNYVQNVAQHWTDHDLASTDWTTLSDEDIVQQLTVIKGVGQWSAQMILMFTLDRPDVFPVNDLGIRNAMVKCYRLRSKNRALDRRLLKIAESWRPYRTLACRYLWLWLDENSQSD